MITVRLPRLLLLLETLYVPTLHMATILRYPSFDSSVCNLTEDLMMIHWSRRVYVRCQEEICCFALNFFTELKITSASSDKKKTYVFLPLWASRRTTGIARDSGDGLSHTAPIMYCFLPPSFGFGWSHGAQVGRAHV